MAEKIKETLRQTDSESLQQNAAALASSHSSQRALVQPGVQQVQYLQQVIPVASLTASKDDLLEMT